MEKKLVNATIIIFMVIVVVTANMASMGYITNPVVEGFWLGFNSAGLIAVFIYLLHK